MLSVYFMIYILVNRHTGGLESLRHVAVKRNGVNRHTGGLEITRLSKHIT